MKRRNLRFLFVISALTVQCLAIGWLIVRYERVVQRGEEVRFKCQAYDPYDPLLGRYLRMTVNAATTNFPLCVTNVQRRSNQFVVRIEPATNGLWQVAEAAFKPSGRGIWVKPQFSTVEHRLNWSDRGEKESWEAFRKRMESSDLVVRVNFPERLFVNEKLAPAAEKLLREQTNNVVAVYRVLDGEIVLIGIEIAGKSIIEHVR